MDHYFFANCNRGQHFESVFLPVPFLGCFALINTNEKTICPESRVMHREREHFVEMVSQSAAFKMKSYDDAEARFMLGRLRLLNCAQLNLVILSPKSNLNPLEIVNCFSFSWKSVQR